MQPDVAEVTSSGDPGREQGDSSSQHDQRGDRVHVGKEEDGRAKSKNEAADEGAGEAEDKPLLGGSAGAETGGEHGRDSGGDTGPRHGLIDDVAEGGAEVELEGEGDGLGLPEAPGTRRGILLEGRATSSLSAAAAASTGMEMMECSTPSTRSRSEGSGPMGRSVITSNLRSGRTPAAVGRSWQSSAM